jgi:hypothetical protein
MAVSKNIAQFHNFLFLILQFSNFFGTISDFFELQKFQTHNMKVIAKDEKSQYQNYLLLIDEMAHRQNDLAPKISEFDKNAVG